MFSGDVCDTDNNIIIYNIMRVICKIYDNDIFVFKGSLFGMDLFLLFFKWQKHNISIHFLIIKEEKVSKARKFLYLHITIS